MENQMKAPQQPKPMTCENLLDDLFTTYKNEDIQEGLDRMLCALVSTTEFAEEGPIARENAAYFVLNLKKHFNRANEINNRKEGINAAH